MIFPTNLYLQYWNFGMFRLLSALLSLLILLVLTPLQAAAAPPKAALHWIGSWAAAPAHSLTSTTIDPGGLSPSFQNQTIIQTVRISAGGARLRVRFSNEYGVKPLLVGAARVVLMDSNGAPIIGADRALLFSGQSTASIPPGAPLLSDPVDLPTKALSNVQIALYLPQAVFTCTCHLFGPQHSIVSPEGDYTERPFDPKTGRLVTYRAFLTAVEVETSTSSSTIIGFGDSITDGLRSTADANKRWLDRLGERLLANPKGRQFAVVNAGISGNRLLADGKLVFLGQNALARFDRDVLSAPGASHVIVLEGVNDLGVGRASPPSALDLIAGYRQLISRAHAHGLSIIGATILPYESADYFDPAGEVVRQQINKWIRTGGEFDHVIDFDAVMRDSAHPSKMRVDLQFGDWLHPNDKGYQTMGEAIDLDIF